MENQSLYKPKSQHLMDQVRYERAPMRPSRVAGIVLLFSSEWKWWGQECGSTEERIARRVLFNAPIMGGRCEATAILCIGLL